MRNSRSFRSISCLVAIALLLAAPLLAGELSGRVTGGGRPISDAFVRLYQIDPSGGNWKGVFVTRTNQGGVYLLRGLPNAEYVILVEKDGRRLFQGKVRIFGSAQKDIAL
jgi:hypothetical protein